MGKWTNWMTRDHQRDRRKNRFQGRIRDQGREEEVEVQQHLED
jgi:hypothetical protein